MTKTNIRFLIIALALILIGGFFRLYPLLFPVSIETDQEAAMMIVTQQRLKIAKEIQQLYPLLDDGRKISLTQERFQEWTARNRAHFQKQVFSLSQKIYRQKGHKRSGLDRPDYYLPDSDSYYFYGLTKQLIDGEQIMTQRKGAEYFNDLMLAPLGYWEKINLHPWVGLFVYRCVHIFHPATSPMLAVGLTPIILMALSVIFFMLNCRILQIGTVATALSTLLFVLAPIFLRRSFLGWYDNDIYNILFPLMITFFIFSGLRDLTLRQNTLRYGILSALSLSVYAFFWQGWVYLFSVILIAAAIIMVVTLWSGTFKQIAPQGLFFFGTLSGLTLFCLTAAFGIKQFFFLFQEGGAIILEFFSLAKLSPWPDIYLSVGELHRTSIAELIELVGSGLMIIIALLGFGFLLADYFRTVKRNPAHHYIFLALFFISALILTLKAQRFSILLIAPLSLLTGYGFQKILAFAYTLIHKCKLHPKAAAFAFGLFCLLTATPFVVNVFSKADNLAMRIRPIFNSQWDRLLTRLKEETPAESIIHSWWPPGHFIKAWARRRVTFDGATINVPQAYWIARALYAHNEQEALGLLRMLNTSANRATEFLQEQGFSLAGAVDIIHAIVPSSPSQARHRLKDALTPQQMETLLSLTHGSPPPSFLLLYDDLIEANIGIGFAARWNIRKMEEINAQPELLRRVRAMRRQDFIEFLWNLQGGMLRFSDAFTAASQNNNTLIFQEGILVDLKTKTCRVSSPVFGTGVPKALMFEDKDRIHRQDLFGANLPYTVVIFSDEQGRYQCLLMDDVIASSLLIRLYLFGDKGLKYFKHFGSERDELGKTQLRAFRIDWEAFAQDLDKIEAVTSESAHGSFP